jgi:hypothetical protein
VRTSEGFEVDFLARTPDGGEQLVQVCADLDASGTRDRETRSLLAAAREYPRATLHVVALTGAIVPPFPHDIRLHRAAEWLWQT